MSKYTIADKIALGFSALFPIGLIYALISDYVENPGDRADFWWILVMLWPFAFVAWLGIWNRLKERLLDNLADALNRRTKAD
jgi:hypothetical protein